VGGSNPTEERVFVRADGNVAYGDFMSVMNALQDGGFYKVALGRRGPRQQHLRRDRLWENLMGPAGDRRAHSRMDARRRSQVVDRSGVHSFGKRVDGWRRPA
jgi:hypothetical protein